MHRLHDELMAIAESQVENHIHTDSDDGQKYFDLYGYVEYLTNAVDDYLSHSPVAGFVTDAHALSYYLAACLFQASGDSPHGPTFRGLKVWG